MAEWRHLTQRTPVMLEANDAPLPTQGRAADSRDAACTIPLSAIEVEAGHNPRKHFADAEFTRLVESIAANGLLMPLLSLGPLQVKPSATSGFALAGRASYLILIAARLTRPSRRYLSRDRPRF